MRSVPISRRTLLGYSAAVAAGSAAAAAFAPTASAERPGLGTLVDYAGGVPSAASIRSAGHAGAIRYVSERRPGAEWMAAKPLQAREVDALHAAGLTVVSNYQYGKGPTADWRGGREAGKQCAERGLHLHGAAGGPDSAPIYASIDDNPSAIEFARLIAPYLTGWQSVIGKNRLGIYANAPTIELTRVAGLGAYFWQHDWGTPAGFVHPAANLHQFQINKCTLDNISVDLNTILTGNYGQW